MLRAIIVIPALFLLVCPRLAAADLDETADSAVWLLRKATLVHRDGRHNLLLRSLRQMKDPALGPLFTDLVSKPHPVLKIHGILGLGEVDASKTIDLGMLADLSDPLAQAQLVSTALEAKLLDTEQCVQLLSWPDLDPAVKVIVAAQLLAEGRLKDASVLEKAQGSDKLAMRGMIALIKLQLGDASALKSLEEIDASDDASRDPVRAMLMQTALRHGFVTAVPWAMRIAGDPVSDKGLAFFGLRVGLNFQAKGSEELWRKQFTGATNPADRVRLALLALDMSEQISAKAFETLGEDADGLIRQCGLIGRALKSGESGEEELIGMLELNHLVAGQWVLQYAEKIEPERARPVLVGIVLSSEGSSNHERFRSQRLENCVFAAQRLAESDPESHGVLTGLIGSSPELTQEAVLMGLIKSNIVDPYKLVPDRSELKSDTGRSLALLLRAKSGGKLSGEEMKGLALIVRGGAGLQEPLRIQAAWTYLKLTEQDKVALANVLTP